MHRGAYTFLLYFVTTPYFISFITAQIINRGLLFLITCIDSYRQLFWEVIQYHTTTESD